MPRLDDDHTGARIARQRKLAGLTQRALAARIPYSYSLLHQVEAGHRPASPDLIATVAKELRIDVAALTGQPYLAELQQDRLAALVRPIREALDLYDLGADPEAPDRTTDELIALATELCVQVRATRLQEVARRLPGALAELTTAAYRAPSARRWAALSSAYRTAYDVTVKLGYYDLSTVALDRMDWAAQRAGDPLLAAVRQYMRALVYFRQGEYTIGLRLIEAGARLVPSDATTTEEMAVAGQLHLGAGVIAARAGRGSAAREHLDQAGGYAARTGEAGRVHWLSFGPTNVAVHEVAAHIELRSYDEALRRADEINPPRDWAASRLAHFQVDRARCEMETGRTDAALRSLTAARRLAPQQTRYHPGARETIVGLVHAARRTPDTLDHLAAWIGI